jgi:hypothetical protein
MGVGVFVHVAISFTVHRADQINQHRRPRIKKLWTLLYQDLKQFLLSAKALQSL